jgi:hypothetical protein
MLVDIPVMLSWVLVLIGVESHVKLHIASFGVDT